MVKDKDSEIYNNGVKYVNQLTSPIIVRGGTYRDPTFMEKVGKFVAKSRLPIAFVGTGLALSHLARNGIENTVHQVVDISKKTYNGFKKGANEIKNGITKGYNAFKSVFNGQAPKRDTNTTKEDIHQGTNRPKNQG